MRRPRAGIEGRPSVQTLGRLFCSRHEATLQLGSAPTRDHDLTIVGLVLLPHGFMAGGRTKPKSQRADRMIQRARRALLPNDRLIDNEEGYRERRETDLYEQVESGRDRYEG